jgi:uncharacterized MnhB-related membrane protein
MEFEIIHIIVFILITINSLIIILHKNLKISSYGIALLGILIGVEFVLLQAYILAIVEIGLVSCIITLLLIKTINSTTDKEE